jgi:hypothetical protein
MKKHAWILKCKDRAKLRFLGVNWDIVLKYSYMSKAQNSHTVRNKSPYTYSKTWMGNPETICMEVFLNKLSQKHLIETRSPTIDLHNLFPNDFLLHFESLNNQGD